MNPRSGEIVRPWSDGEAVSPRAGADPNSVLVIRGSCSGKSKPEYDGFFSQHGGSRRATLSRRPKGNPRVTTWREGFVFPRCRSEENLEMGKRA